MSISTLLADPLPPPFPPVVVVVVVAVAVAGSSEELISSDPVGDDDIIKDGVTLEVEVGLDVELVLGS